jgi:hypothetical protein
MCGKQSNIRMMKSKSLTIGVAFLLLFACVIVLLLSSHKSRLSGSRNNSDSADFVSKRTTAVQRVRASNSKFGVDGNKSYTEEPSSKSHYEKLILLLEGGNRGSMEVKSLISGELYRWSHTDPGAALDFMDKELSGDPERYKYYLTAILSGWGEKKPFEVVNYMLENPRGYPLSIDIVKNPLLSAINQDIDLFLDLASNMPVDWISGTSRHWAIKSLESSGKIRSLNFVDSLPRGSEQRTAFIFGFADALAVGDWRNNYSDIERLAEMADTPEIAKQAMSFFSSTASYSDPVTFINWLDSSPILTEDKKKLKVTVTSLWAREDVASYANWLNSLKAEQRTDDLVLNIIGAVSAKDPVSALLWINQLKDVKTRNGLASEIYRRSDMKNEIDRMIANGELPGDMLDE